MRYIEEEYQLIMEEEAIRELDLLLESQEVSIHDMFLNPQNKRLTFFQILQEFRKKGGTVLMGGAFSIVLMHEDWNYIVKVFPKDDPYERYLKLLEQIPDHIKNGPTFPKVIVPDRRITPIMKNAPTHEGKMHIVAIEKLLPLGADKASDLSAHADAILKLMRFQSKASELSKELVDEIQRETNQETPSESLMAKLKEYIGYKEDIQEIENAYFKQILHPKTAEEVFIRDIHWMLTHFPIKQGDHFDIHEDNIMQRDGDNGKEYVLIDPVANLHLNLFLQDYTLMYNIMMNDDKRRYQQVKDYFMNTFGRDIGKPMVPGWDPKRESKWKEKTVQDITAQQMIANKRELE